MRSTYTREAGMRQARLIVESASASNLEICFGAFSDFHMDILFVLPTHEAFQCLELTSDVRIG